MINEYRNKLTRYMAVFKKGNVLARFYDKPNDFLGAMLVGNNIALVIFTYCMTELFNPILLGFMQEGPLLLFVNTIISTIVVLMFGEFLPKTFFRLFSNEALFLFAYPLQFFKTILIPF